MHKRKNSAMIFPTQIQTYFDADRNHDGDQLIGTFAANAVVKDEGKVHTGHKAIAGWWKSAKEKYRHTAEPIDIDRDGKVAVVRATVSGDFPSSPAILKYRFRLEKDRISELEIGA